jgi:hypothetical protein
MPTVFEEFDKISADYERGNVSLPQQTGNVLINGTIGRQLPNEPKSSTGNNIKIKANNKAKRKAQKNSRKQNRRPKK